MHSETPTQAAVEFTQLHEPADGWLEVIPVSAGGRALEMYLAAIEQRMQRGTWQEATRLSEQIPEICSALEHPKIQTSLAHALCWCDAWVEEPYRDYSASAARSGPQPESFCAAMLRAARTWYRKRGACDTTVQQNLAKLRPQTYESLQQIDS
jgi:hypothetical protein